jgi:hypothetical protein
MGLVKFGQLTLSVDQIPDGHVVVPESELVRLKGADNAYLSLKSKIPYGVAEDQLGSLLEKGARFDAELSQRQKFEKELGDASKKLEGFSNLPKDFSLENYNRLVADEKDRIWQGKIADLTRQVEEKVEKELHVKVKVDPRFIDQSKLEAFDPDSKTAFDDWYKILDEAHTAQENFVKDMAGKTPPAPGSAAQPIQQGLNVPPSAGPKDVISSTALRLQSL